MRKTTALDRDTFIKDLAQLRGRSLPIATFYRWLSICGIEPKTWYDDRDQKILRGLVVHLRLGGSANEYRSHLIQEQKQDAQTRTTTDHQIIDIAATCAY